MKTMTCKQLGGSCDQAFSAETFDEMAAQSQKHGMEMFRADDQGHIQAMNEMQQHMQSPEAMNAWMQNKRTEFDNLPNS